MEIVHIVCTDAFAGVERYVAEVARRQAETGCSVRVLGGSPVSMPAAIGASSVDWRPARTMADAQKALLRARADVLHTHMSAADTAAVTTKPFHRRPIVSTLHFAKPRGRDKLRSKALTAVGRFVDAQIAISAFVAEQSGINCEVILNGVSWDLAPVDREAIVLMAQRQEPEKDSATALRAWAASGLDRSGWRLQVAGDGSEHTALVELASSLDVNASVEFLGFVDDVRERIARASIFLATAPAEPFGLSVVEAMAAGTPVIAAAEGAHLETVGTVGSGDYLFRPGAVDQCAGALQRLGGDVSARASYGAALQASWARSFTIERHCEELEAVYERVLQGRWRTVR